MGLPPGLSFRKCRYFSVEPRSDSQGVDPNCIPLANRGRYPRASVPSLRRSRGNRVAIALYRPCGDLHQVSFEAGCQTEERGSDDGPGRGSTTDAPDFEKASEAA